MPLQSYEMKDSGVEWIGEIPKGWKTERLKSLFSFGKGLPITKEDLVEKGIPVISYGQIHAKTNTGVQIQSELIRFVSNKWLEDNSNSLVNEGDFIFADTSEDLDGCGNCVYVDSLNDMPWLFAGYHTITFKPKKVGNNKYLAYLFKSDPWRSQLRSRASGVKLFSISRKMLNFTTVILPPSSEQETIAAYLDEKCAAIDGIIAEVKATIDEYKSWKASVIFEAVTKGLNPNAEMKDSGVEWIGMIPKHWRISRIKNECINMDSLREPISAENRVKEKGIYDYYGASGIIDKIDDYNVDDTVLLIGEDGANLVYRNLPLVYRASGKFWVNNHAHILKIKSPNDYVFMSYMLESGDYTNYITGSAQPKLTQFNLMRFPIPIPSISEQQSIAAYLDEKCAAIDAVIAEKQSLIEELENYKKSLIFETVTGKRRVAVG